ncbi:MAG: sigma-70 family RNA polymerase sigma factor [Planctomycetes bacterium]|nr:sigma-70 family RNA polymerase sigma factor [Planctomycetota bacterium]
MLWKFKQTTAESDWGQEREAREPARQEPREARAATDPIGRYLAEAARTPLLQKEQERRLAQTMARRRAMFTNAACAIPEVWRHAVTLVTEVMRGQRPAMKVFNIGGLSESDFHAHLQQLPPIVARLRELTAARPELETYVEGRDLMRRLKLRIGVLRQLMRPVEQQYRKRRRGRAKMKENWRLRMARTVYRAFVRVRNALVSANLRLVVHVAKQVARHPSQILELIQEGNVGLLYATEKYDAREECQFHSYAYWWIKQSMTRAISNKFRLIREPVNLDEAPQRIKEAVAKYRDTKGRDPTPYELAEMLDISRAQAQRVFRTSVHCLSLDQMTDEESPLTDSIAAPEEEPQADARSLLDGLSRVLATLSPREREVVQLRFGLGYEETYTLEDIARIYNLSRERVRQIELKALEKLRHPSRARRLKALLDSLD